MKIIKPIALIVLLVILTACTANNKNMEEAQVMYENITAEEAKAIMDSEENYIVLDVREQEEYDSGHINGAVLIPYTQIENMAEEKLPHKNELILVYCRSGRRSKIAAETLARLGYTRVKEFGGINDWKYEIEK
ncbi:MAG: rhodanese-like domain-containing protein [Clostridia bacterium]